MGWVVKEGPVAVKLTRKLAEMISNMERCPHDRELQVSRLEHIKRTLAEKRFRSPEWATAFCKETGMQYRVNGKHTSTVLAAEKEIPSVKVIITDYECETLKDVADLYATFDVRFSVRTAGDIYLVYGHSVPELRDLNSKCLKIAVTGMAYATWEDQQMRHPIEERAELLLNHPEFVIWNNSLISSSWKETRCIQRASVTAAMFLTFNKNRLDADVFWREVAEGTNPKNNSPSRILQKYLLSSSVNMGGGARRERAEMESVTRHEMLCKSVYAWNRFRSGDDTRKGLIYYSARPTPEVV